MLSCKRFPEVLAMWKASWWLSNKPFHLCEGYPSCILEVKISLKATLLSFSIQCLRARPDFVRLRKPCPLGEKGSCFSEFV